MLVKSRAQPLLLIVLSGGRAPGGALPSALRAEPGGPAAMNYTFQFGVAFAQLPELLNGAPSSRFELGLLTFWGGALIGLLGASLKTFGGPILRRVAHRPTSSSSPTRRR